MTIVEADNDLAREIAERIKSELEPAPTTSAQDGPQLLGFGGYTLDAQARSLLDPNGQDVTLHARSFRCCWRLRDNRAGFSHATNSHKSLPAVARNPTIAVSMC